MKPQTFKQYQTALTDALKTVSQKEIEKAITILKDATIVYVAGNGGSAAIANHLCCDFTKGGQPYNFINTVSLVANTSMLTAIANDIGYEDVFSYQLRTGFQCVDDTLLVISSSGNSLNITKALKHARDMKYKSIAFTGFDGGVASTLASVNIHVRSDNYGIIEDSHQAIMHYIANRLRTDTGL